MRNMKCINAPYGVKDVTVGSGVAWSGVEWRSFWDSLWMCVVGSYNLLYPTLPAVLCSAYLERYQNFKSTTVGFEVTRLSVV